MGTRSSERGGRGGRFLLSFLELQIAMVLGASVCYLLGRLIPTSSGLSDAYHPGTYLYATGDILFLSVPVLAWMCFRGSGWRLSLEMTLAMVAPVATIALVGELGGYPYLPWLVTGMYPAMALGMLLYMLWRFDRFAEWSSPRPPFWPRPIAPPHARPPGQR